MLFGRAATLRREADEILGPRGLHSLLTDYGEPHVVGSYALELMTWRDLDIYLVAENIAIRAFFELGGRLGELLLPVRMSHRNERIAKTTGLPQGLYWGVYLGNERDGAWKIDVWALDRAEYDRLIAVQKHIAARLTNELRVSILEIKSSCWRDPRYRKNYGSMDIYRSVLDDGIRSVSEFDRWLVAHKGFGISPLM